MLDKSMLNFFSKLEENNHREWFQENKKQYDKIVENAQVLVGEWKDALGKQDALIAENDPKKAIFRIYKDVRFSKDKTPYKTHIGMAIGRGGRTAKWAGWYLHFEPGKSFMAAGKWAPEADELKAIRQEIDYNLDEFLSIINEKNLKNTFGELDREYALKKAPKDYEADHPAIEILKLKSFTFSKSYTDEEVLSKDFVQQVIKDSELLFPFINFLNRAIE